MRFVRRCAGGLADAAIWAWIERAMDRHFVIPIMLPLLLLRVAVAQAQSVRQPPPVGRTSFTTKRFNDSPNSASPQRDASGEEMLPAPSNLPEVSGGSSAPKIAA